MQVQRRSPTDLAAEKQDIQRSIADLRARYQALLARQGGSGAQLQAPNPPQVRPFGAVSRPYDQHALHSPASSCCDVQYTHHACACCAVGKGSGIYSMPGTSGWLPAGDAEPTGVCAIARPARVQCRVPSGGHADTQRRAHPCEPRADQVHDRAGGERSCSGPCSGPSLIL